MERTELEQRKIPFVLSLSKDRSVGHPELWFDKLTTNGEKEAQHSALVGHSQEDYGL